MTLRRIAKEPLLHFFLLGACLFFLFGWLNRGTLDAPDEVVVDQARIDNLAAQFQRVWQRSPTDQEIQGLVDSWIREEILYREGVALGLDVNDSVVRRRIAQKMAFIADGAVPEEPTEAALDAWLQANAEDYRIEPVYSLRQLYFDPARHGDDLRDRMLSMLSTLAQAAAVPDGDATLLPQRMQSARMNEVARTFGADFADALADLPVGEWQGPIASTYGLHLVQLQESRPGRQPTLGEVRAAVERDWFAAQGEELNEAFYQAVRKRYTVRSAAGIPVAAGSDAAGAR